MRTALFMFLVSNGRERVFVSFYGNKEKTGVWTCSSDGRKLNCSHITAAERTKSVRAILTGSFESGGESEEEPDAESPEDRFDQALRAEQERGEPSHLRVSWRTT